MLVVVEEEPIHSGAVFDNELYPLIECFSLSLFSADRLGEFQSARAWSSEVTRAPNTDLLGNLILRLSKRLCFIYPFTGGCSGRAPDPAPRRACWRTGRSGTGRR